MASTCKNTMKVNTDLKVPRKNGSDPEPSSVSAKEAPEKNITPATKKASKSKAVRKTPARLTKPAKKRATKSPARSKEKTPEDAILQSTAVDPDIEKASIPKTKVKPAATRKTSSKKTTKSAASKRPKKTKKSK